MFSYRHAFHAGSHADVLKHTVIVQLLRYLRQKDKAYWYIDTHAGAGVYSLKDGYAAKTAEFESGITKLWKRADLPVALSDYVEVVRAFNPDGQLRVYPGSPYVARHFMRAQDRMRLFELHPTEIDVLRRNFRSAHNSRNTERTERVDRRAMIFDTDGFSGIKALLPPPPRRALVLIDPSYEDKHDYASTLHCIEECLKRFATGMYAIWYPQVARSEAQRFTEQLKCLPLTSSTNWLHLALTVCSPPSTGLGLYGSGMFILNPPYTLEKTMRETLPYLATVLGEDSTAQFIIESSAI